MAREKRPGNVLMSNFKQTRRGHRDSRSTALNTKTPSTSSDKRPIVQLHKMRPSSWKVEEIVLKKKLYSQTSKCGCQVGAQNLSGSDTWKSIAAENDLKESNPQSEDLVNWNKKCAKQ